MRSGIRGDLLSDLLSRVAMGLRKDFGKMCGPAARHRLGRIPRKREPFRSVLGSGTPAEHATWRRNVPNAFGVMGGLRILVAGEATPEARACQHAASGMWPGAEVA